MGAWRGRGADRPEVLRRLGHVLAVQAEGDLAGRLAACAFRAASAAWPGGQARERWRSQPHRSVKGRASARRGRGTAQDTTHRDVEEHLGAPSRGIGRLSARHSRQQPGAAGARTARRSAVYRLGATGAHASIPHLLRHLGSRRDRGGRKSAGQGCAVSQLNATCAAAPPSVAIARRDDECRSVHTKAHAGTHRRAGAAARRAAGSAADNRRELSDVALMTADDIGVNGDGSERGCAR